MPGLVVQALKLPSDGFSPSRDPALRVGFTATRKIGSAVIRNRAKRRLRAAVHDVLACGAPQGGPAADLRAADLVLVARQGTVERPYADLKADLRTALDRLGIVGR